MADIVQFPGDYMSPETREKDRWVTLALAAIGIAGRDKYQQEPFLRAALDRFADVPDDQPDPNDTQAFAKFAVQLLLRALLDDGGMRERGDATFAQWLHDAGMCDGPRA
jgi:hypothetical protein